MDFQIAVERMQRELDEIRARQEIWTCLTREARGRDRHDAELTSSCYWPDGADEHGPHVIPGPEYGEAANAGHRIAFAANSHNLTNHLCEIDGDVANCETYVIGGLLSPDQTVCKVAFARYIDRLERREGQWKIKVRRCVIDAVSEGAADWLLSPEMKGFLRGIRSPNDPSYGRPIEHAPGGERW